MPRPSRSAAGEAIRRVRIARGLSQRELAGDRYTPQYISVLESGRSRPSERALNHIADRLGVTLGSLLDGEPKVAQRIDLARLEAAEVALTAAATALRELRLSLDLAPSIGVTARGATSGSRGRPTLSPSGRQAADAGRRKRTRASLKDGRQPPLQRVIHDVLTAAGEPLPAAVIASRVTAAGWIPPRSGHELRPTQVYARTTHRQYRHMFTRREGLIGLAD